MNCLYIDIVRKGSCIINMKTKTSTNSNRTLAISGSFSTTKLFTINALSLLGLTILSGTILASSTVSADDNTSVVDQISITVPVSCTMSGTGMDTHNATINNGTYVSDIGTTTLHAFCNDNEGFAIYAAGYTGDIIGDTNSNKLVGTSASSNTVIDSGLATSAGNPDVSNWAMKLAMTQDSGDTTSTNAFTIDSAPNVDLPSQAEQGATPASFSSYHVVPNEYVKVAHKNSNTDMAASTGGVKLTTTYAAYISKTQPADTYTGQVIYTLVHPASAAAPVVCNPNGTTIGTNTGTDVLCMQDITATNKSSVMASMTPESQYTLKDKRDGKEYKIAKLADNKVWMTQNLDLDIDSNTTYTNEDTDLGWNTSTNTYQTASWTPSRSTYETTADQTHEWCQDENCQNSPESYDPGDLYWNGTSGNGAYTDYTSSTGAPQYHLGNYYNWPAAIASNDASVYGVRNETTNEYENLEANQSICPAGWTLPYISSDLSTNDFATLWTEYGWDSTYYNFSDITNLTGAPLYFTPAGSFGGGLRGVVNAGYFWSPVAGPGSYARGVLFGVGGYASPAGVVGRYGGYSVRCLLR